MEYGTYLHPQKYLKTGHQRKWPDYGWEARLGKRVGAGMSPVDASTGSRLLQQEREKSRKLRIGHAQLQAKTEKNPHIAPHPVPAMRRDAEAQRAHVGGWRASAVPKMQGDFYRGGRQG